MTCNDMGIRTYITVPVMTIFKDNVHYLRKTPNLLFSFSQCHLLEVAVMGSDKCSDAKFE